MNKDKLEIVKNSSKHMEQSVKSNSFEKFKAAESTAHTWSIFQILLKKRFLRKSNKPGLGNAVLIYFNVTSATKLFFAIK